MPEPVIVEALRTPFGRRGGALREQRPDSLLAHAIDGLLDRAGVDPARIGDVIDGPGRCSLRFFSSTRRNRG